MQIRDLIHNNEAVTTAGTTSTTTTSTTANTGARPYVWRTACNACRDRKRPCEDALNLNNVGEVPAPDSTDQTKEVDENNRCQYCQKFSRACIFGVSTRGGRKTLLETRQ
ncbi:hypothetical protein K435DRAFT_974825 [Dendrothele bispora CBS 962.96]|uniref:Zn(2)-C6 fungal-type domain-containing protein n=1 Tax=Dendrothele bispora (strain CBS 962.96) TaxID=1314807 RepID=A0A4S8KJ03_DENBC|nr:hypothetical protein K435DRAFT_974825 [Dendrothele bispora CBS 962.96]